MHERNNEIKDKVKVRLEVKKKAIENKFCSARDLVEDIFIEYCDQNRQALLPDMANTIRLANKTRAKLFPTNPLNIAFELNHDFIPPNFFRGEVSSFDNEKGYTARHLIFMSDNQIKVLSNAKRWYVDGTFYIVDKKVFHQLFTIHAFIKRENIIKQVPLAFVLMTGRKTHDYESVFKKILEILPFTRMKEIVSDFEKFLWKNVENLCKSNANPSLKTF